MIDLEGDVAVVTGAGSGIGRATALTLARAGATVAAADLDVERAADTAAAITAASGRAGGYFVDVASTEAVADLRAAVVADLGAPTVVANVAGWDVVQPFLETDPDFWQRVLAINLFGTIAVSRAFLEEMVAAGKGGRIVNIASDAGRVGSSGETVYAGAKGGVIAFTKSLAREVARYEVRVNCVCPGPTDTPMLASVPDSLREALVRSTPLRRLARPDDIANAVAFLASDLAAFITGQVLSVSGGLTMNG
jgi:2-hydroxycyclohexanecarboxyl-CoA dehydrogenase